ncbi:MAG: triose-phosphate isomerase, partial [Anaerolineales bacterium]
MIKGFNLKPPFFELGPKAYLYGAKLLELARFADNLCVKYNVQIIITPQCADIPLIARETSHVLVFAQHIDALKIGRGIGSILPEAVKEAGAVGALLNHVEKKLTLPEIEQTIRRADEVGLATMVCADNLQEAVAIAKMSPNVLLVESPSQIEAGKREINDPFEIENINQTIWEINPEILVLHGGGISSGRDVYNIIKSGAQATGSTSGVILAVDPQAKLEEMISAMRQAWDEIHSK